MRRRKLVLSIGTISFLMIAGPAWACGGLVGANGTLSLGRTTTLAAYHDGIEHYITGFSFAGSGAAFGSIVPLPGVPTEVAKAGDWTLQRLLLEVQPPLAESATLSVADADRSAEVILETTVDSLDITVVKGGGAAVGTWARENGFGLSPDAPEVLDFYAARSPVFMAVRFNAERAKEQGLELGQATPVQVTIPTDNPWVPLRILALGKQDIEPVQADVFLLTERRPALLPKSNGLFLERSEPASDFLLQDLRSDSRMEWLPTSDMWFTYVRLDTTAGALGYDLAVDATGRGDPSEVDAGLAPVELPASVPSGRVAWMAVLTLAILAVTAVAAERRVNVWR
ncbi:MAG TPA: DUF2330 domain-containing protein [Actinomycetota bacterium]|jgi:hypothetical protein|nr:DUF2330 domain-containing protein [Actinomycetota bacterium]